jgi:serine/threonine protein kinase
MKVALHFADLPASSQRQFYNQRAEESEDSEESEEPVSPEECYVQDAARSLAQEHALMVECAPHTERTLRSHVYGRVRTREGYDAPCLLVDYAAGGSLGELLRALKSWYGQGLLEEDTRSVIRLIAEAILVLHRHAGALHRDLKPDNILLMQPWPPLVAGRLEYGQLPGLLDSVVLADYGLARRLQSGELAMTQAFSVDFEVPEVMAGGLYDWRVDAFLLGLMVPACAFGDVPLPENRWQTPEARARVIGYDRLRQQVQDKPRFSWMTAGHCGSFLRCTLNPEVSRRDSVVTLFEEGNIHPYLEP